MLLLPTKRTSPLKAGVVQRPLKAAPPKHAAHHETPPAAATGRRGHCCLQRQTNAGLTAQHPPGFAAQAGRLPAHPLGQRQIQLAGLCQRRQPHRPSQRTDKLTRGYSRANAACTGANTCSINSSGRPQPQAAGHLRLGKAGPGLVVQPQRPPGVVQQHPALAGRAVHRPLAAPQPGWPTVSSSRLICGLMADWLRPSCSAAETRRNRQWSPGAQPIQLQVSGVPAHARLQDGY